MFPKILKSLLAFIWIVYCLYGVVNNYSHYSFSDWIVILLFMLSPFIFYYLFNKIHKKKLDKKHTFSNTKEAMNQSSYSRVWDNEMRAPITQDAHITCDTFISQQDDIYLNTLLPNGKTIREQQIIDYQMSLGIYQKDTPSYYGMRIVANTVPPVSNYNVLNGEEMEFFKCFHDELIKNKIRPDRIILKRLSSGCFNVEHIDYCYVGKIHLCQPPTKYSVFKDGNKRATKIFYSVEEANAFIASKNNYSIHTDTPEHIGNMQYLQSRNTVKDLSGLSVKQCIEYIPYWIKYIKYCKKDVN